LFGSFLKGVAMNFIVKIVVNVFRNESGQLVFRLADDNGFTKHDDPQHPIEDAERVISAEYHRAEEV